MFNIRQCFTLRHVYFLFTIIWFFALLCRFFEIFGGSCSQRQPWMVESACLTTCWIGRVSVKASVESLCTLHSFTVPQRPRSCHLLLVFQCTTTWNGSFESPCFRRTGPTRPSQCLFNSCQTCPRWKSSCPIVSHSSEGNFQIWSTKTEFSPKSTWPSSDSSNNEAVQAFNFFKEFFKTL